MIRIVLILLVALTSGDALSEVTQDAPKAEHWVRSVKADIERNGLLSKRIIIVDSFDNKSGAPKFFKLGTNDCPDLLFFKCVSSRDAGFALKLNGSLKPKGVAGAAQVSGADLVIYPDGETLRLTGDQGKTSVKFGDTRTLKSLKPSEIFGRIFQSTGFDGIVLAISDPFVLVGSVSELIRTPDRQGLAMADSHLGWVLESGKSKGASLLSIVNYTDFYAVFRRVVTDKEASPIQLGTKVILESK